MTTTTPQPTHTQPAPRVKLITVRLPRKQKGESK